MRGDCTSKYNRRLVIHLLALLGVLSISFSAIFVRLSGASPVTATFYRGAYAAPVLLAIWLAQRSGDRRGQRERGLASVSGLLLALDLNLWHESIAGLGSGVCCCSTSVCHSCNRPVPQSCWPVSPCCRCGDNHDQKKPQSS
jgi:hypothetical protein